MRRTRPGTRLGVIAVFAMTLAACGGGAAQKDTPVQGRATGPGSSTELATSAKVPAAQGQLKISDAGNNNTGVELRVQHLARPTKIDSTATTFMVWAKPLAETARVHPLGALTVNDDLSAQLNATTPLKSFEVFVTAESSSQVQEPQGDRLLWATVSQR